MLLRDSPSADVLATVKSITESLFPGSVDFTKEFDPSEPDSPYVVFTATAQGEWKDYRDAVVEWHRRVHAVCPEPVNYFRLEILPQ